jgi:hypothetical protein
MFAISNNVFNKLIFSNLHTLEPGFLFSDFPGVGVVLYKISVVMSFLSVGH